MNKTKVLIYSVIVLIVLNISVLTLLVISKNEARFDHRPDHKSPKEVVIEELHFDKNQCNQYSKLIDVERKEVRELEEKSKIAHEQLYSLLGKSKTNEKAKDSLLLIISNSQHEIELNHFNHFIDIKKICHPNQIEDFNHLANELARIFGKNKKPRRD